MELSEKLIRHLKNDAHFAEYVDYVFYCIDKLDTIDGLAAMNNETAGQEARIRAFAKERLLDTLQPIITYEEKKETSEEELQRIKEQYAID